MSGTNVEAVRALVEAFAQRDFDAAAPLLHAELEIRPGLVGGLESQVYVGPEGMRQFWVDIDTTWADFRITPERLAGGDARRADRLVSQLQQPCRRVRGRRAELIRDAIRAAAQRARQRDARASERE